MEIKGKKLTPLVLILALTIAIGGAVAYLFWTSPTFSTSISVSSIIDVKINIDDVTPFPDFSALTTITDFHPGNMLRFAVDEINNNIQNDLNLTITATGAYISAGGIVSASIQRYTIDVSDTITPLGSAIAVPDVNSMLPTLLADIAETGTPGSAYVEVVLSAAGGTSYGDYDLDIVLELTDGV